MAADTQGKQKGRRGRLRKYAIFKQVRFPYIKNYPVEPQKHIESFPTYQELIKNYFYLHNFSVIEFIDEECD